QIDTGSLHMRVGDATYRVEVEPKLRPELTAIVAKVRLPEYLGQPAVQERDARGGAVGLVKGSRVALAPTVNRQLQTAQSNGKTCAPTGASFTTPELLVNDAQQVELQWQDEFGLTRHARVKIAVAAQDDEAPQISCEDLPRGRVVLDSEQL